LLLDIIAILVPRALACSNVTAAAIFRTVELAKPTLLIDEADTFLGENDEMRGILNSGHRTGGQVIRTVGDDFEPRIFATHCPAAIGMIGKLPDTLADRSVTISMKRRSSGEKVAQFRFGRTPHLTDAAMKAARWAGDNSKTVHECDPAIPSSIFNRAADNWRPLLAIVEVIGGDWMDLAKSAATFACGIEEEQSFSAEFLADIRTAFVEESRRGWMSSADLVAGLVGMPDRPWGHGKALSAAVEDFWDPAGVGPKDDRLKGYRIEQFTDAFTRYC
jgi:uncharacterized protein DUF3631